MKSFGISRILFCWIVLLVLPVHGRAADLGRVEFIGYLEAQYYLPHNEFDPNPGVYTPDRVVSRYGLLLNMEAKHKDLPKLFLFTDFRTYFGDNRPGIRYTHDADPIASNAVFGIGYKLLKQLDLRISKGEWLDLGNHLGERLPWSAVSVRYTIF